MPLVSEVTTGLGEAWDGHFSPTIVFRACPRHYIPVVVPCPPAGRRSISVAPQACSHPRTIPLNSRRSCGASDLGLSASLTPLISDIKNEPISWKSRLRLSSTSRVPSTQSPERSVSRSQISQQRRDLRTGNTPFVSQTKTACPRRAVWADRREPSPTVYAPLVEFY